MLLLLLLLKLVPWYLEPNIDLSESSFEETPSCPSAPSLGMAGSGTVGSKVQRGKLWDGVNSSQVQTRPWPRFLLAAVFRSHLTETRSVQRLHSIATPQRLVAVDVK
jgi:hypothetical protein